MARIPIVHIDNTLIATVQEDLRDHDALELQEALLRALERTGARGVLIDISVVGMVDSFLGRLLGEIASGTRLMGAHTIVVGMQPAVAITFVEMGLQTRGFHTVLNAEKGRALLRRLLAAERNRDERRGH
jgi:rsbT antagonist protein RsbS